jgi:S-adenosylmethionine-diacylglycerol 3-amino-3-carboxypropyl transferase
MSDASTPHPLARLSLDGRRPGPLMFAQVREDPSVDVAAIRPAERRHVLAVTSGGCTALAMLGAGAKRVTAVDSNPIQNDLADLVAGALTVLDHADMLRFIGAAPAPAGERLRRYAQVRPLLTADARRRWDGHRRMIARGAIHAGLTERAAAPLMLAVRHIVQRPATVDALLAADDPVTQREVFDQKWDTRRWRMLFRIALNRVTCRPLYRTFFDNVNADRFPDVFRSGVEHALRNVPVAENWYVHDLFEGAFRPDALPPHLRASAQDTIRANRDGLRLVDGSLLALLHTLPDGDVDGFSLSNVGEWLTPNEFENLLHEVIRVAAQGAIVVFRNFIPRDDPVPASLAGVLRVANRGSEATAVDRSLVRYQTVIAQVHH